VVAMEPGVGRLVVVPLWKTTGLLRTYRGKLFVGRMMCVKVTGTGSEHLG